MQKLLSSKKGFSLIELLIYVGILAVSAGILTGVLQTVVQTQVEESAQNEVSGQLNFTIQTIQRLVRESSYIDLTPGSATSTLRLKMQDSDDNIDPTTDYYTLVYLQDGMVFVEEEPGTAQSITGENVTVDSLSFTKFTQYPARDIVQIDVAISGVEQVSGQTITRALRSVVSRASAVTFDSDLLPGTDNSYQVGNGSYRWQNARFAGDLTADGSVDGSQLCISGDCKSSWGSIGLTGSGTTGYVSKWSGSSSLGNSVIYDDGTNVGIGTASPGADLHVKDTGASSIKVESGTGTSAGLALSGDYYNYITSSGGHLDFDALTASKKIQFRTQGTVDMVIDSTGNVGIGDTDPDAPLQVDGALDCVGTGTSGLIFAGDAQGENVCIDYNEIMARNNGSTSTFYIQNDGGNTTFGSGLMTIAGTLNPDGAITLPTTGITGAGTGSGLDADKLDGYHASDFAIASTISEIHIDDTRALGDVTPDGFGNYTAKFSFTDDITGSPNAWDSVLTMAGWIDTYRVWQLVSNSNLSDADDDLYFRSGRTGTWGNLRKVWDEESDGEGSGLNADFLDGSSGTTYLDNTDYCAGGTCGALTITGTLDPNGAITLPTIGISGAGAGSGLNADLLDGYNLATVSTALTVPLRNSSGDINTRLFRSEYDSTNPTIGYIMTQIDTASNNYIRPSTPLQLVTGLGLVAGGSRDIWVEKGGDTMTGTLAITGSLSATGAITWETAAGVNRITNNDGGGNVQIRFGHDYSDTDERFTHSGTAFYLGGNLDAAAGTLQMKVASNGGAGDNVAVTWGSELQVSATAVTFGGTNLLDNTDYCSGGTCGALTIAGNLALSSTSYRITGVGLPIANNDVATKEYVDLNAGRPVWAGYTASTYTGALTGLLGANAKCDTDYDGSHWASLDELMKLGDDYPATAYVWVREGFGWFSDSTSRYDDWGTSWVTNEISCVGWSSNSLSYHGAMFGGYLGTDTCDNLYKLACVY